MITSWPDAWIDHPEYVNDGFFDIHLFRNVNKLEYAGP
jgi:hypothetical protein